MFKYWQTIPKTLLTALFVTGLVGSVGLVTLSKTYDAVAQNPTRPLNSRERAIERLKRSGQRWIEIRLRSQRLLAWEGNRLVYAVIVSTGKGSTPTPMGVFAVQTKYPVASMQGDDYYVPDVPNVMYYSGNYAIHGAYWHNSFGIPVSHGCTNVAPDHAAWLYRWASVGTPVVVN